MTNKLTSEQRVQKQHVWLMNNPDYCLYSGLFVFGNTTVSETVPTACTDGLNVIYGDKFVQSLTDQELRGLILHETMHKAFRHLTVWQPLYKKNPKLANMACDFVINLMIRDSDPSEQSVKLPDGGCVDEKYRGMDAAQIYKLLEQEQQNKQKNGNNKQQGEGDGQGNGSGNQGEEEPQGFDEHDWDSAQQLSEQEREAIANEVDQILRQGAVLAGRMKGKVSRAIGELLESRVNWREVLRNFVSSFADEHDSSTWRRPNRRWVDQNVYMPSAVSEAMGEIVVAVDTSGSIGQHDLSMFLSEVMAICRDISPERVHLMYWDTRIAQHETYERGEYENMVQSTKPAGGGGTSVLCVPKYIKEKSIKPECVLVLTDGYLSDGWGTWEHPVFWGITTKGVTADMGVSVYVGD
jgi:predicted metal-dependent peptidase